MRSSGLSRRSRSAAVASREHDFELRLAEVDCGQGRDALSDALLGALRAPGISGGDDHLRREAVRLLVEDSDPVSAAAISLSAGAGCYSEPWRAVRSAAYKIQDRGRL